MKFSRCLVSESGHKDLLARQNAEIKLLKQMHNFLARRLDSVKQYASNLKVIISQAEKMDIEELGDSTIAQCWASLIGEAEKEFEILKVNADYIGSRSLESLGRLLVD